MSKKVGGSTILVVSKAEAKKYQAHKIAESAGLDKRERFLDGLFRFPSRYRRFYRRGARFSPRQYLDRGCLDVSRKGDPILGLDGICL